MLRDELAAEAAVVKASGVTEKSEVAIKYPQNQIVTAKLAKVIFILSGEHNEPVLDCIGDAVIQTPNLNALAARASFAIGRYVHEHRCWDNAIAYDGKIPSWGHRLMAQGHHVVSIGKLHYASGDDVKSGAFLLKNNSIKSNSYASSNQIDAGPLDCRLIALIF